MKEKNRIGYEIRSLSNLLQRKMFEIAPIHNFDLTEMQRQITGYIHDKAERGDIFQKDIEEEFCIRRSTASRILSVLEEKQIIKRVPIPQDARLKKICLLPKAYEQHEYIKEKIKIMEALLSQGLSKEEIETFVELAEKIKKNII